MRCLFSLPESCLTSISASAGINFTTPNYIMIRTGKATLCFEPSSNARLERHVYPGGFYFPIRLADVFSSIADRFKVIADTEKTNILLLGVVPFLPSLGSWKPFLLLLYICVPVGHSYLNPSAVTIKKIVCIFFYTLCYLTRAIWGLLPPGTARSWVTILLCSPGSQGCHHCDARDCVHLHCSWSSIWSHAVAFPEVCPGYMWGPPSAWTAPSVSPGSRLLALAPFRVYLSENMLNVTF